MNETIQRIECQLRDNHYVEAEDIRRLVDEYRKEHADCLFYQIKYWKTEAELCKVKRDLLNR